jgi:alpha-L-arabinofuranosidase
MKFLFAACLCLISASAFCQETYTVRTRDVKATIPSTLWGLFFEDINRAADGGVYAEMIENRSFDFPDPMTGWTTWPSPRLRDGIFIVTNQSASNTANPRYLAVNLQAGDTVGVLNQGFGGLGLKKDQAYNLTLRYRLNSGNVHVRSFLFSSTNRPLARQDVGSFSSPGEWMEKTLTITPSDTASIGKLLVIFEGAGKIDIDRISLFPTDTWKSRPGGLRTDLVQKLADMHPGFLRFPGGCIVEGRTLNTRYQWKKTIGPLEDRQLIKSIWNDDVAERQTPDYFESFGLGFLEYFQLCEDIGASPLPIINCGMSCQFDAAEVAPVNELDPYIQDALDLIEFANGDQLTTQWGAKRASLGHPEPFHMKMIGVGNENWGPQYAERLALFTHRIKAKYPDMTIVCSSGYTPREEQFKYIDSVLRAEHVDIIDEHFYQSSEWFLAHANRYDHYDRKGPKIFVGEFAAQSDRIGSLHNENNLRTALAEAAFMTGIERNADVVEMASYAPLFAHTRDWQWTPNLIWFDNLQSFATPNYYVQQLFSVNKGTQVVSLLQGGQVVNGQDSCWGTACLDAHSGELIVKLVNMSSVTKARTVSLADGKLDGGVSVTTLAGGDPRMINSMGQPSLITPKTEQVVAKGKEMKLKLEPYSLTVVRVKVK